MTVQRGDGAVERDRSGRRRDLAAKARDRAADLLDREAEARDELARRLTAVDHRAPLTSGLDVILRAELDRQRATEERALSAVQRALAAQDRAHAARDRERSASDRAAAVAVDRLADSDDLTAGPLAGRRPGPPALQRDVDRAHRTGSALTAIVVAQGPQGAGPLSPDVVGAVLCNLRSYDPVIRIGGDDDCVAALCNVPITDARARFRAVQQALAQAGLAIRIGYAELAVDDTPTTLVDRAEADLVTTPPPAPQQRSLAQQTAPPTPRKGRPSRSHEPAEPAADGRERGSVTRRRVAQPTRSTR